MTESKLDLAKAAHNRGDKDLARQLLKEIVQEAPQDVTTWLLLAEWTDDVEEKIRCVRECHLTNYDDPRTHEAWDRLWKEMPRLSDDQVAALGALPTPERIKRLRKIVQEMRYDSRAWLLLYECTDDWGEKIECARQAICNDQGNPKAIEAWHRVNNEMPTLSYHDPDALYKLPISESLKSTMENFPSFYEKACSIRKVGAREGLTKDLMYERIIKLTYRHYLCKEGTTCILYYSNDDTWLLPVATIVISGELTLRKLVRVLAETHPKEYERLSELLFQDPQRGVYISKYRLFVYSLDDWTLTLTVQRVIMDDHFRTTPLDQG